jgi:hypothetical protein
MFNPIQVVIDAFVRQLQEQYEQVYGVLEPGYPGIIEFIARLADALDYLRVTQEGKFWIASLYAHVFSEEHRSAIRTR